MSSSEIIGGPFSSDVRTQLTRRQSVQKDNNRSSQELQHLNSRTAWVKMVSSVEDSSEKNLAKKNILAGGLQGYSGIKSYTLGDKGYRPSPGITGMQVTSVGRFGLLREATVNFNCWNVEQLEDLEKLFMRPGFSVLLEWGNTYYIDKDGNFSTVIPSVADLMITPPGSSAGQTRRDAIQKVIREKRAQSGYNYDAILGVIKNFSWRFRPDGGYDCTTVIVSSGEIVQSLTVDVDVDTVGKTGEVDPVKKAETPTMLNAIIREIEEGTAESIWTSVESLYPDFALKYKTLSPTGGTIVSSKYQLQDGTNFSYIRMDSLLNILNTVIVCDKDKNPLFRFFTDITSSKVKTSFRTYSYHTSSDPGTCLISGASVDNWKCGQTFEFLDTLRTLNQGIEDNNILGIWVNTTLVKDAIKTLLNNSTKQNRSIVNFISPILSRINEALGGSCTSLDLHYEEEESTYYIVDRNFKEKVTYPEIVVTGLKSTTTDFDFTSKLTPNLIGMLAISAQADTPDSGVDIENFFEWNRGLTDRVLGSKYIKTTGTTSGNSSSREADQQKRYDVVYSTVGNFFAKKVYNLKTVESAKNSYADFTRDFNYLYNEYVTDAGPKGIIPFEGTITMDGISGIKIGQVFKINTGVMPKKYDDIVGFTVTGVDHVIQNNRWYTKLKAQTTIVKYSKKKSNFSGTFKCVTLPTVLMNTLTPLGTGLTSLPVIAEFPLTDVKLGKPIETVYIPARDVALKSRPLGLKLLLTAHAAQEGFYPGTISYDLNNPGNFVAAVGNVKAVGRGPGKRSKFVRFATLQDGILNSAAQIDLILSGRSSSYKKDPTLLEYISVYAPASDGNNPGTYTGYIISFFKKYGITVTQNTKLSDVVNINTQNTSTAPTGNAQVNLKGNTGFKPFYQTDFKTGGVNYFTQKVQADKNVKK